ncbi:MAG: polysaccharide biosynthesis tyrosine autokinase [Verrucomicrobiales bacterium]|nr:polysaccharide biosynthesis tyrosine autokinase [Verrucomicrobiales bacterium]
MNSPTDEKKKFDPVKMIGHVFSYTRHIRLMFLMGAVGLTLGIVYFLFSTPTYRATSLVSVQGYAPPVRSLEVSETFTVATFNRAFLNRFRAPRIQLAAAKKLGLVDEKATQEAVIGHVPAILVAPTDSRHVEVTVLAYDPKVVRNFTQAMVDEFLRLQNESWTRWREEALRRYADQMQQLEAEIQTNIESLTAVEREQNLTAATLEQQSLLEIPKKMIQTKERIALMEIIRDRIQALEENSNLPEDHPANDPGRQIGTMVELLSLLGRFEDDTAVAVGDVVNNSSTSRFGVTPRSAETEVVVEPSQLEGIEPWRELERERRILESEIEVKSETFLPDHEVMRELQARLADNERKLGAELKVLKNSFYLELAKLEENLKVLESRMPEYYEATEKVGKSAYAYASIAEQQQMWDQAKDQLSKKLAAISFSDDFDWVQLRYEETISLRDEVPVSPSKRKLAILSLVIGLAGALGVPTLLNLFDTSAHSIVQLEESTGLNGIGIIPLTSKEMLEDVHRSPTLGATTPNYLLECFRIIRSNICLHPNSRGRSQVLVVTSSRPQEGKTTQSANLAWAFHSMGEKTILLDCDLRRGRVHELIGLENDPGMTHLLTGECTLDEATQISGPGGFDAIPGGPVVAGTTDIFSQRRFEKLIDYLRQTYDRIIIDSPPVLGLSETASLQRVVDGTVLVVKAEETSRKDVSDAITLLQKSDAHFFGFVLNAVDLSRASNYYNYYYYSAPYYDQLGSESSQESSSVKPKPDAVEASPALSSEDETYDEVDDIFLPSSESSSRRDPIKRV